MIQFDGCIFFKRVGSTTNELCIFEARDSLAKWLAAMVDADGEAAENVDVMKISLRALRASVCVCGHSIYKLS